MPTIYDQLGRETGIGKAVDLFYDRVLADRQLSPYFTKVDPSHLRRHQAALLASVTGGPSLYEGRDLAVAHTHLGITEADFLRVAGHLGSVLRDLSVDEEAIDEVMHVLMLHKDKIAGAVDPAEAGAAPGADG